MHVDNSLNAEIARKKRNEYQREWRKKNPDKVKAQAERYWARKAEKDMLNESEVSKVGSN